MEKMKKEIYICYVCNHKIQASPQYITNGLYRHQKCIPGGTRYMRNKKLGRDLLKEVYGDGKKAVLGAEVKEYREKAGLTLGELGVKLGVGEGTVRHWEDNPYKPIPRWHWGFFSSKRKEGGR